jgi:hypothetical protein
VATALGAAVLVAVFWPRVALPLLVVPLFLAGLVAYAVRPAGVREVHQFERESGLTTSPTSRRFIAHHLTTGRRLRVVLVIGALLLPGLLAAAVGTSTDGRTTVVWSGVLWGCIAGTLWAELSVTRPSRPTGGARVASLVPREPAAYLGRPLRWGPALAALAAMIVWAGVAFLPDGGPGDTGVSLADGLDVAAAIAFALVVPLVVAGAQRWILGRPQPLVASDLVAADDALRAASVRNLASVGAAMGLLNLAGGLLQYVEALDAPAADWLFGVAAAASLGSALAAWWSRAWWRPVRRPTPSPVDVQA